MRILVVEDIDARYARIAEALRRDGREIVRARTAAQAIERLGMTSRFDAILLDHDLDVDGTVPREVVGTGMEVVAALERARQIDPPPYVIVHSKNVDPGVTMALRLMAVGYPIAWIPYPPAWPQQLQFIRFVVDGIDVGVRG